MCIRDRRSLAHSADEDKVLSQDGGSRSENLRIMDGLLQGMRVVEASAFVAAPLGGMTLAQLGADVIRVDPIGGGLDARRWPVTEDGTSLFWAGLNKGKRSVAIAVRSPRGRELFTALITAPGELSLIHISEPTRPY